MGSIPKEFQRKSNPIPSIWPYILVVFFFVSLDLFLGYLVYNIYLSRSSFNQVNQEVVEQVPEVSATKSFGNKQPLEESLRASELEQIQNLADAFMQGRLYKNLEQIKSYVTRDFLDRYTQDDFAGPSSMTLKDYEVIEIKYIGGNTYRIVVQTNWLDNNNLSSSQDWILIATKTKEGYKINDYSGE